MQTYKPRPGSTVTTCKQKIIRTKGFTTIQEIQKANVDMESIGGIEGILAFEGNNNWTILHCNFEEIAQCKNMGVAI